MKCPKQETLFKYQMNRLPPNKQRELKAHIEDCSTCRNEQAFLKLMNLTFADKRELQIPAEGRECCNEETLSAYIDRTLTKSQRVDVEAHLAQCERCLSELVVLYDLVESMKSEGVQPTPDWLLERARVSLPEPHRESWWKGLLRPFEPRGVQVAAAVATICLLIAIGVGIFLLNRGRMNLPGLMEKSLVAAAKMPESSSALKETLPIAALQAVDDRFIRAVTGAETQASIRYFRLGVYSATMVLSLQSVEASMLVEYHDAILSYLQQEMQYLKFPMKLMQFGSQLRQDLDSGLYTPNEVTNRAQQLDSEVAAYIQEQKAAHFLDFLFGKWALSVSLHAKQAQLAQKPPSVELRELLKPKWIQDFRAHLQTTEWNSRPRILSALTKLESLSYEMDNPATLPKIEEEAQRILNAYFGIETKWKN
jgi:hypothetical protein